MQTNQPWHYNKLAIYNMKTWLPEIKGKRNKLKKTKSIWILTRKKTIIEKRPKLESGTIGKTKTKKEPEIEIKVDDQIFVYKQTINFIFNIHNLNFIFYMHISLNFIFYIHLILFFICISLNFIFYIHLILFFICISLNFIFGINTLNFIFGINTLNSFLG